ALERDEAGEDALRRGGRVLRRHDFDHRLLGGFGRVEGRHGEPLTRRAADLHTALEVGFDAPAGGAEPGGAVPGQPERPPPTAPLAASRPAASARAAAAAARRLPRRSARAWRAGSAGDSSPHGRTTRRHTRTPVAVSHTASPSPRAQPGRRAAASSKTRAA